MENQNHSEKKLYLIGTHHLDLNGPRRLESAFNYLNPKIIALEMSGDRDYFASPKENKKMRQRLEEIFKSSRMGLNPDEIGSFLDITDSLSKYYGYELTTSKDYAARNPKTTLEYIDISFFKQGIKKFLEGFFEMFKQMLEAVSEDSDKKELILNMIKDKDLSIKQHQEEVDAAYKNKGFYYEAYQELIHAQEQGIEDLGPLKEIFNPKRDDCMLKRIRELYASFSSGNLCSILGLAHLPGIQKRIEDLSPVLLTLPEAARE